MLALKRLRRSLTFQDKRRALYIKYRKRSIAFKKLALWLAKKTVNQALDFNMKFTKKGVKNFFLIYLFVIWFVHLILNMYWFFFIRPILERSPMFKRRFNKDFE